MDLFTFIKIGNLIRKDFHSLFDYQAFLKLKDLSSDKVFIDSFLEEIF